jgi:hypothetical protein
MVEASGHDRILWFRSEVTMKAARGIAAIRRMAKPIADMEILALGRRLLSSVRGCVSSSVVSDGMQMISQASQLLSCADASRALLEVVHSLFADRNLQISTNRALGATSHMDGWTDDRVDERLREVTGGLYPYVRLLIESCRRRSAGVPVVDRMYGRLVISRRSLVRLESGREPLI